MRIKFIQKLIDKIRNKNKNNCKSNENCPFINSSIYGKIYVPPYYLAGEISSEEPKIFNSEGEKLKTVFLRDRECLHVPLSFLPSKYFVIDRYNFALKTQIYTHKCMLETMGNPDKRIGMLLEPKAIHTEDYELFDIHKGLEKDFDFILTYDDKLLDKLDNARFFNAVATIWYRNIDGNLSNQIYQQKTKDVSMVCSEKAYTMMHKVRHMFAHKALTLGVDIYGTFNGGVYIPTKEPSLTPYRYQIVIENDISSYYFTEKILDCFASMTIPIYVGATRINDFFNPEGIIQISPKDLDNLENILKKCSKKEYLNRLSAVKDNYNRSLKYLNPGDNLYTEFIEEHDIQTIHSISGGGGKTL